MIKASSARQVAALVSDLGSDRVVTREAAIARLTVIGGRAVDRVSAVVDSSAAAPAVRAAALRVLEAIADARGLDHVLAALDSSDVLVATAAVSAARPFLLGASGVRVVDRLTTLALATGRDEEVRLAALRTLRGLEQATVAPLLDTLRTDPSASVRAEAAGSDGERPAEAWNGPQPTGC
jgi:HEAT repeat protein